MTAGALRIGVTGHRVLAEVDRVTDGIDAALSRLAAAYPGRPLTLVTALAEGADRLAAERVLARPAGSIVAVLPLAPNDYEADFTTPASRDAFRALLARADEVTIATDPASREAAYERAGRAIVERSDALLAVWDGRPSQGRGGTADIVALARARRLPLAWVQAGNRQPGTAPRSRWAPRRGS